MISAGNNFQDLLGGVGAPLVREINGTFQLIGVLSDYQKSVRTPVVYARLTSAREWIKQVTGI